MALVTGMVARQKVKIHCSQMRCWCLWTHITHGPVLMEYTIHHSSLHPITLVPRVWDDGRKAVERIESYTSTKRMNESVLSCRDVSRYASINPLCKGTARGWRDFCTSWQQCVPHKHYWGRTFHPSGAEWDWSNYHQVAAEMPCWPVATRQPQLIH